jgi:hypothetical protein
MRPLISITLLLLATVVPFTAKGQSGAVKYCLGQYNSQSDCTKNQEWDFSGATCTSCQDHFHPGDYIYLPCEYPISSSGSFSFGPVSGSASVRYHDAIEAAGARQCASRNFTKKTILSISGNRCGYVWFSITCK